MLIIIESSNFSKLSCSRYYGQISFHLVFSKLTEFHCISKLNASEYGKHQSLGRNLPQKIMISKLLEKFHINNRDQHITISPCIKFQSIWLTLDFVIKFVQKCMTDKNFGKIKIKIITNIQQCTPVQNFSHFVDF